MPRIFIDMDGVLADFDKALIGIFGFDYATAEERVGTKEFWKTIHSTHNFYAELPVMEDAEELVEGVKSYDPKPIILTGLPWGGWAFAQKRKWRDRHFPNLNIIGCPSKEKCFYGLPGQVLIDDREKYKSYWVEMGGIWITHKSAKESLDKLKEIYA